MSAGRVLEEVWRTQATSMRGALMRRLGDLDRAEDALQEALAQALKSWPTDGVPAQPAGWLVTTAWRKAVDQLRREEVGRQKLAYAVPIGVPNEDDVLALIFGCCHPSLGEAAQIALTLRAVCGLSTEEIASAFLVPVPTMAQRLVRANRLIKEREVPFAIPAEEEYAGRLTAVLTVIYLVFNEGYLANSAETAQRPDLARQGIALIHQLEMLMPGDPEVSGLAVLLELHQARAQSRFDAEGRMVLLSEQDRSTWDSDAIKAAVNKLDLALARRRPGRFQTHAAIAALHATAPSYADTDWLQIRLLYLQMHRQTGNPLDQLSASVATWHARDAAQGLAEADALAGKLAGHRLFHATRAQMLRALGRDEEARAALDRALSLAVNPAERLLLTERLTA